ncbi:MAG: sigma-70 family RNA polymerase sigma factor, partial [Bacteroidetes bacterium]|nr:sigma-70 family RNA polymerase sigma factor [Bacteroidota bacterium]
MKFFKPKYASQSDEELLTAMSKGDKLAFDEIYKRYAGQLRGYF